MNPSDSEPPRTPTKLTGNGGAGQDNPDGEEEMEEPTKEKQKCNGKAEYTMLKRWVTCEKAEMPREDIDRELLELARDLMQKYKLKKILGHLDKPTNVAMWEQFRNYQSGKIQSIVAVFGAL